MSKSPKQAPVRVYRETQIKVEAVPLAGGEFEKQIHIRYATRDYDGPKLTQGTTPWVVLNIDMLDGMATQLASLAASVKAWTPGEPFNPSGSNVGVVRLDKPHDG